MAKKEKSNDALDILILALGEVKDKIINILAENNVDDKIILDIIELFQKYFKL